jgi:hypothetical protein
LGSPNDRIRGIKATTADGQLRVQLTAIDLPVRSRSREVSTSANGQPNSFRKRLQSTNSSH